MMKILCVSLVTLLSVWTADRINHTVAATRLATIATLSIAPGEPVEHR